MTRCHRCRKVVWIWQEVVLTPQFHNDEFNEYHAACWKAEKRESPRG